MKTEHFGTTGFDFEVGITPSYFVNPQTGEMSLSGGHTVYGQGAKPLANVGGQYNLFTNQQFVELAEQISEIANLEISHYTSVNGGANVLVAFKNGTDAFTVGGTEFTQDKNFILMDNRMGTRPFQIGSNYRLNRCANMFTSTEVVKHINHNNKMPTLIQELVHQIELQFQADQDFIDWQIRMAGIEVDQKIIQLAKKQLLNLGDTAMSTTMANKLLRLDNSLQSEMAEVGQNAWGLFNGITHFTTHNLSQAKFFGQKDYPLFGERQKLNSGIVSFLNEQFN